MDEVLRKTIIDFLKSFTRLIVQANLYSEDHPQVKEAAKQTKENILLLCEKFQDEKITISLIEKKFIMNGTQILSEEKIPNSILNLYKKTASDSIEIIKDISEIEIIKFVKIISSKEDISQFLEKNLIKNIKISSKKYIKADKSETKNQTQNITEDIKNLDFNESLKSIVSKLTSDPELQNRIIESLMEKFKIEVEKAIEKAIKEIKEEKIKAENDYIRTENVILNIAAGEIMIDKDGNIIMTKGDSEKITGKELKEIAGKKIFDVTNIEEQVLNIAKEIKTISDKKVSGETVLKGNEELIKTIKSTTAVIKNQDGKIVGTLTIPPELAKIREVEQLKSDFISSITHELRSPLTSIKMALDLISRENITNPSTKSMLNTAIRNAERLNSIINDILDFSKLQSGKMIFRLDKYSPYEIIQDAIDSMKAWANSKNINLIFDRKENISDVYVDKKRTEQILINLISNAIKFTPEGGTITVAAYIDNDKKDYVCFYVKDTGCGIKKEDQEKIFEKFVQLAKGENVGGTGLGLAITKFMTVMQNGKIELESEVGKGSTFKIYLPVYKGQEGEKEISFSHEDKEEKSWIKRLLNKLIQR